MNTHLEVVLTLSGETEICYGEAQKIFDASLELDPLVMKSISYEYFNLEDKK